MLENLSHPPLRIAIVAPPWFPIPPGGYGGIGAMVHTLVPRWSTRWRRRTTWQTSTTTWCTTTRWPAGPLTSG